MYKLAIIGGGPAGYTAAERAAHHGLTSVIFEKKTLGGTCLNEGCIPTKALLYGAKTYTNALNAAKYGVNVPEATFDYAKMHSRKTKVVRKLVAGIKAKLNNELTTLVAAEASVVAYDKEQHQQKSCVIEVVEELQQRGYEPGDIAILVRRKVQGVAVAQQLLDYKSAHPDASLPLFSAHWV